MENSNGAVNISAEDLQQRDLEMEPLKIKELRLMLKAGAVVSDLVISPIKVKGKSKPWFEITFKLKDTEGEDTAVLITSLNDRQRWSSLSNLYDFIEKNFPKIDRAEIQILRD